MSRHTDRPTLRPEHTPLHPSIAVAPASETDAHLAAIERGLLMTRSTRATMSGLPPGTQVNRGAKGAASAGWFQEQLSKFQAQSTGTKVLVALGGVAALAGVALLLRRSVANAKARRAVAHAQLPPPSACSYTQLRVEAGSGREGIATAYAEYQAAMRQARTMVPDGAPWFVLVGAANSAETGTPWCPDCRTANPIVHGALERLAASAKAAGQPTPILVAAFVDRPGWKDLDTPHALKTDGELHLARIPTLFKFVHGCNVATLVETECHDPAAVDAFLKHHE